METIYGSELHALRSSAERLKNELEKIRQEMTASIGLDPVEHLECRIKSDQSMREKCRRKGLPETADSALRQIHDAIGFRVVCAFLNDVYTIRDRILSLPGIEMMEEKDYIRHVKPNGYRSYHLIVRVDGAYFAEFQLRTISMDTWAALEHHLKYKRELGGNTELIVRELKRCADELASTDLSMQTLRDMILPESERREA